MANNIAVSVTADVADLTAKRAIMSAELRAATKDLNDFAKTAKTAGMTDELRTSMLASADAVAKTRAQIRQTDAELRNLTATEIEETVATEVNTAAHVSGQAAREALVLVHEALSGNFHRMAGSLMIEAQALAGAEATTNAFAVATSAAGLTVIGTVVALAAIAVAAHEYNAEQEKLTATTLGLGAASGLAASQLEISASVAAEWSGESKRASLESAEAFAAAGVRSQAAIQELSQYVQTYAELTGEKAADAQKALAEAMNDPIKGAEKLNEQLSILDSTQLEQIRTMVEAGDKTSAVNVIIEALRGRMEDARTAGVGLNSTWQSMTSTLSDFWNWLGKVDSALGEYNREVAAFYLNGGVQGMEQVERERAGHEAAASAARNHAQAIAELNHQSAAGAALAAKTPEAADAARKTELSGALNQLRSALTADTQLHGANSDAVKRDKDAIADYTHALTTYLPAAEKAHKIAQLDAQIATARHSHDQQRIADLTKQRELLNTAGQLMSGADANQRASDAAAVASQRSGAGAHHGPSIVQEWSEQLHAQEIASGEFFKDQTAKELEFWQSKAGLVKQGSKEWLEVQSHIYEASKSLAHQDYQDHLADLNDRIAADHDNWSKEKADWETKLDFIKSKFGEESSEYKNAHREWENEQRRHASEMEQAQRNSEQKQLATLKSSLAAQRTIRQDDARTTEALINNSAAGSPFGEIRAAREVAELHQQLNQQELADLKATYDAEAALLNGAVTSAEAKYTQDSQKYKEALAAKLAADQAYQQQRRVLEDRAMNQSIQDIIAVQQKYHSYIDGVVGSTVSGLVHVAGYTQTWQQAVSGIYNSLLNTFDQMLTKMVTKWVIEHVFMSAKQRAQLAIQRAQHAAAEAAKTGTTAAGVAARTGAESSGFFAKMLGLLGIHLGAHTANEAAKTGATAAGAAARAATETAAGATALTEQGLIGAAEVTSNAAIAASAAFAATAAIPIVGPELAPAAAAAAEAATLAFLPQASLAVGTNYVPNDMVAQIHAGERIIPAADNRQLMSVLNNVEQARAANSNTPAAANDGDSHFHYHDHSGTMTPSQIMANRGAYAKAMKQAHREGHFAGFKFK